ncbi:MAG: aminomethyl transferase family protein [Lachnospiraceae bacterium]|nr:aminomethyl transferase family protein [Lachnospiraceae bacterium]
MKDQEMTIQFSPLISYKPEEDTNRKYTSHTAPSHISGIQAFEYAGWRDECMSWHKTCYLHSNLNPAANIRITGSECIEFFKHIMVNSFEKFPVGSGKHAIFCNKEGFILTDGVLLCIGENEYEGFCLSPVIDYYASMGEYDVKIEPENHFVYQLCGPNSLAVVEAATGEDLKDIKFFHHRKSQIAGKPVRILRIGMAGSLGYEVHGEYPDSKEIYNKLLEVGAEYGLQRLGKPGYDMAHWEGGFPQMYLDWLSPSHLEPGLKDFPLYQMVTCGWQGDGTGEIGYGNMPFEGSASEHPEVLFRTPYDNDWAKTVKFDHDFIGKEALEKIAANPPRQMVTLEWNVDDILTIVRSQFEEGEPYLDLSMPNDSSFAPGGVYHLDYVYSEEGKEIGVTCGRMNSWYYHKMISICPIDREYSAIGTKVEILWGNPGKRQMKIRATVARYPYLDEGRNDSVDAKKLGR